MGARTISIGMRFGTHNILTVEFIGFQSNPEKISIAHLIPEAHFVIYLCIQPSPAIIILCVDFCFHVMLFSFCLKDSP